MFYPLPDVEKQSDISLPKLLESRDVRQARQQEWMTRYQVTLISFTVIFPGPSKDNHLVRKIFNQGLNALKQIIQSKQWDVLAQQSFALPTGPECFVAIDADAIAVKIALIESEEFFPIGRLWDFDVFDNQRQQYSRNNLNLAPRKCLICKKEAKICARQRTHPLSDIIFEINRLANINTRN